MELKLNMQIPNPVLSHTLLSTIHIQLYTYAHTHTQTLGRFSLNWTKFSSLTSNLKN